MKLTQSLILAGFVMAIAALASPGCGNSGLVGGDCANGYTNCSNSCVNLQTDQHNCGRCGHECTSGVACIQGMCGGVEEAGGAGWGGLGGDGNHYRDGSALGGDGSSDATGDHIVEFDVVYPQGGSTSVDDGSVGGGNSTNGGSSSAGASAQQGGSTSGAVSGGGGADTGATDSSIIDASLCVPPYNDALHCGDCATVCPPDLLVCAPAEGTYACRPMCDAPLVNCFGSCVYLNSDPDNCGSCGVTCPSRACQDGICVGTQTGHFIAICMNYRTAPGPNTAQTTLLLGNAVFIPRAPVVRILAYDEYADPSAPPQVNATIARASVGQEFSITQVHSSVEIPPLLSKAKFDVFLVYEQPYAPAGELSSIGSVWASSLESFGYVGGVIVMLDGGQGVREMTQLFTSTRLFTTTGEVGLSSSAFLQTRVKNDVVGNGMSSEFPTQADTCGFETSLTAPAETSYVITESIGDAGDELPVVVHSTLTAPQ